MVMTSQDAESMDAERLQVPASVVQCQPSINVPTTLGKPVGSRCFCGVNDGSVHGGIGGVFAGIRQA